MHGTSGSLHGHFHSLCIRRAGWRYICNMGGCVAQPRNFFSFHRKNHMGIHVPDTYTDYRWQLVFGVSPVRDWFGVTMFLSRNLSSPLLLMPGEEYQAGRKK